MHISCLAAILPRRYVSRILVSTLSIVLIAISASAQDLDWAKLAYGTGSDGGTRYDWGRGVASLNDGSTAILGEFQEDLTLGFGEANETTLRGRAGNVFNLFVARYNPDGTLAWAKQTNGQARPGKIAAFAERITAHGVQMRGDLLQSNVWRLMFRLAYGQGNVGFVTRRLCPLF